MLAATKHKADYTARNCTPHRREKAGFSSRLEQYRKQRSIHTRLVVTLASCTVRHVLGPLLLGNLHLALGDHRSRQAARG